MTLPEPPGERSLKRKLGLWQVTLSGIGVILGAGVYALVGPASLLAGNALWLAFLLAAVTAGLTAYSYARMGSMRPKNSPEFQYTSMAFGPRIGFIAGWLMVAADLLAAAAVALGFGGYLHHLAGTPLVANALALLVLIAIILYAGVAESVGLAVVLTIVEAGGLLFVIATGIPSLPGGEFLEMPRGFEGVWAAVSLIFFAYLGFDELGNFAEEMQQPERDLPRALFVAMAVSTAIYMLVALTATAAVGWERLSASDAPLALVVGSVLGPKADLALSLMALAATSNTVLLLLVSASRSVYGMASAGVLPAGLARVGGRNVPVISTGLVLSIAGGLMLIGDLARVASLTNAAILSSFALTSLSLPWLWLQRRIPRRLLDIVLPSLGALACLWLLLNTGWQSMGVAALLAVVGLLVGGRGASTPSPDEGTKPSLP